MGKSPDVDCESGRHVRRTPTGSIAQWGFSWSTQGSPSDHQFLDLTSTRWEEIRDAATSQAALEAELSQAEATWWQAQPATARVGMYEMTAWKRGLGYSG